MIWCYEQLFTLRQGKWVEVYPPMNTARSILCVSTSDGDNFIVIGGLLEVLVATVEIFQVKSRRWRTLTTYHNLSLYLQPQYVVIS